MAKLDDLLEDLVTANHMLAKSGHRRFVRPRQHPPSGQSEPLSSCRARARPSASRRDDIMEFNLECDPIDAKGQQPYLERSIHGAAYQMRPDVMSVIHNHSPGVIPYGITGHKMRPIMHMCATIGHEVPIWDQHKKFGDTDLLVTQHGAGPRPRQERSARAPPALMRGHGCRRGRALTCAAPSTPRSIWS